MTKNYTAAIFISLIIFLCLGNFIHSQVPGTLYGSTGSSSNFLITIDPITGAGAVVDSIYNTSGAVTEIEFRSDEVLFGSTGGGNSEIVTIDPLTGIATLVGIHAFGAVNGLDFDASDNLYGAFFNPGVSTDLVTVNQLTGALTTVFTMDPTGNDRVTGLTFSPGGTLYGVVHQQGPSTLVTINPSTSTVTPVGPIGFDKVGALEFGPNGMLYGAVGVGVPNAGALISVDSLTGAGTLIGPTGFLSISGLSFVPGIIPVELTSFTAVVIDSDVYLNWTTATELNNGGFDVERNSGEGFKAIGFIPGFGTSAESHSYDFTDAGLQAGKYIYRLKQVDFDGTFEYSEEIEVEVITPLEFALEQNYPNPFNPSTQITYQLAGNSNVLLKVYDLLGNEVAVLVDEQKEAGRYQVDFDARDLTSGIYIYSIQADNYFESRKMMLIK